ncbi:MAG: hypothetical protein ABSF15_28155 [Candidatus Sulfotelmatobacter sp.]
MIGILGSGPPLQLTAAAGFTVRVDEIDVAEVAVIVTPVADATLPEETENVVLVLPAGIVTEDGTDAAAELPLASDMTTPPVGAGLTATTVPVEPFPLTTEFGAKARDESPIVVAVVVEPPLPPPLLLPLLLPLPPHAAKPTHPTTARKQRLITTEGHDCIDTSRTN